MKTLLKYICIAAAVSLLTGCYKDELSIPGKAESIEFIMRPTSFNGLDVSEASTKALLPEEVTPIESAIYSKYYMVFDNDGNVVKIKGNDYTTLGVDETSMVLSPESGTGPFRVCFFANISKSYFSSISKYSDLSTQRIELEYADHEETGYIGIPVIDGNMCFPMYGEVVFPSAEVTPVNNKVIVPLERLFAKVTVGIRVDFDDSDYVLDFTPPSIEIDSYTLHNLPNKVCLNKALREDGSVIKESSWVSEKVAFEEPYTENLDMTIADEAIKIGDLTPTADTTDLLTFYIPEFALEPSELNTAQDQRIKPTLFNPDKFPVQLTFSGTAKQDDMVDLPVTYNIFFGEDPYDSFSLRRNTWYNNTLILKGTFDAILGNDQRVETEYCNIADPNHTGEIPANCYIVSKPGKYKLPTYIGNQKTLTNKGTSVELVKINGNNSISEIKFDTEDDGKHYIKFDVNLHDANGEPSLANVTGGNHLLILKNGDDVVWSWHLWFCEDDIRPDLDVSMTRYPNDSGNWNNYYVMNRALGATNPITLNNLGLGSSILGYLSSFIGIELNDFVWQDGLYYQWGRKDPLLPTSENIDGSTSTAEAYSASIKNPQKFYSNWDGTGGGWSSEKSIDDPCPPGYKVPSNSIWRSSNPDAKGFLFDVPLIGEMNISTTTSTAYTYNLTQNVSETSASGYIFFPYSTHYNENGIKQEAIATTIRDTTDVDYTIPYGGVSAQESIIPLNWVTPKQFRNIIFEYDYNVNYGMLWASDQNSLTYGYSSIDSSQGGILGSILNNRDVISCEYRTGTVNFRTERRQTGTLFGYPIYTTYYIYDGTVTWNNDWRLVDQATYESLNFATERPVVDNGLNDYLNAKGVNSESYLYDIGKQTLPASGLQVRCVREDSPVQ